MRRMQVGFAAFAAALFAVVMLVPTGSGAQRATHGTFSVHSKSDAARKKLDRKLSNLVASGTNKRVYVFATVRGSARLHKGALRLLRNAHAARGPGMSLVVGSIRVQQVTKLAGASGVLSVRLVELKQTARPPGIPEPGLNKIPSLSSLQSFMNNLRKQEVPYSAAPALKGSNFEQLKDLALLDAKTHGFAQAWQAGYTGDGETGAVLDGGTDWGHPDLIGTWRNAASGWPRAFDPFGTLIWLSAPSFVDQGLSWYVRAAPKSSFTQNSLDARKGLYRVNFATRTGPSRNFSAPDGTRTHSYTFPKAWTKSGTVMFGSHPDDHLLQLFTERPAFIVTDPNTAGVYDTVYVDLDDDYEFADEKPVTKASPVSYRDMNGDGYTDLSGGLLYFISDGTTPLPGGPTSFGLSIVGAPGRLLAWTGDFDPAIEGHGTLTASNVVGQGVVNGNAPTFDDVPGGTYPGAVIGGAPKAKLLPFGDIYFSFDFSTQFAYFLTNAAGANVTSNSYGSSAADNDGYDAASQEAAFWNNFFGGRTTGLFSTGNGAPGYGTTTPPAPYNGIKVGASTQFGGTGWDSIANASQITDNDVMVWSNRGPGATGATGVDVVADGAFSAGDLTLNSSLNGQNAWETWGGTSRSAPVASAATLLVYDAWKQAHGNTIPANFEDKARQILKSSAKDLKYDSWVQGSGSVDANRATQVAASGGAVTPDEWRPGDYRGTEYPSFANVIAPGGHDAQTFTIDGSGTYAVSDRYLQRTDRVNRTFKTSRVNKESIFNFNAPDYLVDISDVVQAHPDADLMVVRANFPYEQFDGNGDYSEDQAWRLLTYNWTDVNHDGRLWTDADGDGAVDHVDTAQISNVDANKDINFAASEMQKGEYVRFMYHRPGSPTLQSWVRQPNARMADGLFLGFQHTVHNPAIEQTNFRIRIDFYKNVDWPWVSTPSSATGNFTASIDVPAGTAPGMYDGAIVLRKDGRDSVVPISVAVKADLPQDAAGNITGSLHFGGAAAAAADDASIYNNGTVFGATDWTWRPESGDWRFFYYDAAHAPPAGTLFLADTTWDDSAPYTDLDTLIMGRSANTYQLAPDGAVGAPYILDTVGKSANTNIGAGVWTFNTATGGNEEIVAGPAQEGLHMLAQHQVNFQGDKFDVPFETTLGSARVTPSSVVQTTAADTGSFDVTFQSTVDLSGLSAEAFGLSQPSTTTETAHQDDPNDPSTASVKKTVTIQHASRARFEVHLAANDLDLYVLKDGQLVGSSTSSSGDEVVELTRPADGTYEVWVHGFSVTGTPTFPLTIDVVQGNDLTVSGLPSGAVPANTPVTIHVAFSKAMTAGQSYFGELQLGPPSAPAALSVPVRINRS